MPKQSILASFWKCDILRDFQTLCNNLFFSQKDYLLCGIFITNVFCFGWSRSSSLAFMTTALMTAARMSARRTKTTLRMHFRVCPRRLSSGKSLMEEASVSSIFWWLLRSLLMNVLSQTEDNGRSSFLACGVKFLRILWIWFSNSDF